MSFSGVSLVADGKLLQPSAESAMAYSGTARGSGSGSGYHLLVVEGYSRVKGLPNGEKIIGRSFTVGGYRWALHFYPNGKSSRKAGSLSIYLVLDQDVAQPVEVRRQFSFIDEIHKHEPTRILASSAHEFSATDPFSGRNEFIKQEDLEKSEHLKNDCFTIRCDLIITEASIIQVPPTNIFKDLKHLLKNMVGTDVTFKVGRIEFAAHRCMLAARSKVFKAELFGFMKEGTTDRAIRIKEMEPNVFKALLDFIYTDSMPKMETEAEAGSEVEVMWLQHLLAAADRYDLQRLKSMCEKSLSGHIDLSSALSIINLAARHNCCGLKEACLEFLQVQTAADWEQLMTTSEWKHIGATEFSIVNELITKFVSKARCS